MYMFFWFFKQLYYCLRRIFKSGILLLLLFFVAFLLIFVKPSFAFDFQPFDISNLPTLPSETEGRYYIITTNPSSTAIKYYLVIAPINERFICNGQNYYSSNSGTLIIYNTDTNEQNWTNRTTASTFSVLSGNNTRSVVYSNNNVANTSNNIYFPDSSTLIHLPDIPSDVVGHPYIITTNPESSSNRYILCKFPDNAIITCTGVGGSFYPLNRWGCYVL